MLVRLGKLLGGEEKSKEGDIDIGVHDEVGALYARVCSDVPSDDEEVSYMLNYITPTACAGIT